MSIQDTNWTDERKKIVATLWNEGQSATYIASVFGVSRCAVLGVVHRMGLSKRRGTLHRTVRKSKPPIKFNYATNKAKSEAPRPAPEPFVLRETIVTPEGNRLSFEDLVDGRCKYAHGERPPYSFCGAKSVTPGVSWCPTHFHVVTGAPHPSQVFAEADKNPEPQPPTNCQQLEAVS